MSRVFRQATYALILLCTFCGCSRRRAVPALPPGPATTNTSPARDTRPGDASSQKRLREVVVLFNSTPGYMEVATQLRDLLPRDTYRVTLTDLESPESGRILGALRGRPDLAVVAVGLPAARLARDRASGPVVFAQVFNYKELLIDGREIRGVSPIPPLELQAKDWKRLDPQLRRVGLIVSNRHSDLINEARQASEAAGLVMEHQISSSDRETLYLFKRLAANIDGLWLVPDDRILSPGVLGELLSYAASHGVRVCVFSEELLTWGAYMSASPTSRNIALTILRVLEEMLAGKEEGVPSLMPLTEITIRVNQEIAARMKLTTPERKSWTVTGGR